MTGRSEFDKIPNAAAQTVHDLARANERLEREVAALREAATEARDALGKAKEGLIDTRSAGHAYARLEAVLGGSDGPADCGSRVAEVARTIRARGDALVEGAGDDEEDAWMGMLGEHYQLLAGEIEEALGPPHARGGVCDTRCPHGVFHDDHCEQCQPGGTS